MTSKKVEITYTVRTGRPGRPQHFTKTVMLPVWQGPISGRIKLLIEKHVPVKGEYVKHRLVG